ncbi:MAG: flagellar brake protein [Gemmatimonadota bacterium]
MLKTTPLPEERSAALAPYWLSERADIVALLNRLQAARFVATCHVEGGFLHADARIAAVMADADALVLNATSEFEHEILLAAHAITAVGFHEGVKIQFSAAVREHAETAAGVGARISMPREVLRLQRRAHERVKPPRNRPLECVVRADANVPLPQRLPVLDISVGGVALLGQAREAFGAAQRLVDCRFDLGMGGLIISDLVVHYVDRGDGTGRWRYGCAFADIDETALEKLCTYVERTAQQQRAARLSDG